MTKKFVINKQRNAPKKARETFQNLFAEKKDQRQKKTRKRYQNLTEEEKEEKDLYYCARNKKFLSNISRS